MSKTALSNFTGWKRPYLSAFLALVTLLLAIQPFFWIYQLWNDGGNPLGWVLALLQAKRPSANDEVVYQLFNFGYYVAGSVFYLWLLKLVTIPVRLQARFERIAEVGMDEYLIEQAALRAREQKYVAEEERKHMRRVALLKKYEELDNRALALITLEELERIRMLLEKPIS